MKQPKDRLARWALKLSEYDIEIKHRSGKSNGNADAISRLGHTINSIQQMGMTDITNTDIIYYIHNLKEIREAQRHDNYFQPIIDYLENEIPPSNNKEYERVMADKDNYTIINEILYRIVPTHTMIKRGTVEYRLCIPRHMASDIIKRNHNDMVAGHLGLKKTYGRISAKYYWNGCYSDVRDWIGSCTDCNMRKGRPDEKIGGHFPITVNRPWQIMGTDIMGPFPKTKNGHRYILTFTDHFTKWVEAFPIEKADAVTIAKHYVEDIICRHGAPEQLLSDRGKAFIGQVMQEVNKLMDVRAINTSPYKPSTNGLTERFNKTLVEMLSMYVESKQKDWDIYIPYVVFAYRTAPHASTNETPFYLLYGRDARYPSDLMEVLPNEDTNRNVEEYKQELTQTLARIWNEVKFFNNQIQQKRELEINRNRKEHKFNEGDLVWLYTKSRKKGLSPKLMHPWHGPFRVIKLTSPVNVKLQFMNGRKLQPIVHVSRLKKYTTPIRPMEDIEIEDEQELEELVIEATDTDRRIQMAPVKQKTNKKKEIETKKRKAQSAAEDEADDEGHNDVVDGQHADDMELDNQEEELVQESEYEVEEVLAHKYKDGQLFYSIKWRGFPREQNTWEPEENCIHARDKISEYRQKCPHRCFDCGYLPTTKNGLRNHRKTVHKGM